MRSMFSAFARASECGSNAIIYGTNNNFFGSKLIGILLVTLLAAATAAASAQNIAIGQVLPLSGPLANVGKDIERATRAHFDVINQRGGINGRKLELFSVDDGNDANKHTAAVATLLQERGVVAFVNCFGTVGCMAEANALKANV
jgi:branched-chain amino acid transport system substrate-binding protein